MSGLLEAVYFALLSGAYARGDLSLVYPIARGTAPVLSVFVGIVFLGERLGPVGAIGRRPPPRGILSLQRPWAVLGRSNALPRRAREAAWLAVATGISIACYSAVDRVGARSVPPWLYATLIWSFTAVFLIGGIALVDRRAPAGCRASVRVGRGRHRDRVGRRGRRACQPDGRADRRRNPGRSAGAAPRSAVWSRSRRTCSCSSPTSTRPLSVVAPVRESAIVLVSGWGSFRLGEAASRVASA